MPAWKAVPGYEGSYEVSDLGDVRALPRVMTVPCRWGGVMSKQWRGRVLKPWSAGSGYRCVALGLGREHRHYVHRLVARAFIDVEPFEGAEVNHRNGNKLDNSCQNLEWVTRRANCLHATHILNKRSGQFGLGRVRVA